jgi:hypothetical protein
MSRLVKIYEWSVVCMAMAVVLVTAGSIYFQFLDGQVFNVPITFNDPHRYELPINSHAERPARDITHLTTKTEYRPGEMVQAYVDIIKTRPEPGLLQWQLMDQRFYPYVNRKGVLPVGHHHQVVSIEKIPLHVPPGQYHFSGTVSYEVNFLRTIHIPMRTNCFQVVDK